jgi:signal transduction histidine kinase
MTNRTATRLAWVLWAASIVGALAFAAIELIRGQVPPATARDAWGNAQEGLGAVAFPTVGAIIASRRRENALGWLFLMIGVSFAMSAVAGALQDTFAIRSTVWQWGTWLETWTWVPGWFSMVTFIPLLFPDGHLLSPRWRWAGWAAGGCIVLNGVSGMFDPTAGNTAGYNAPLPTLPLYRWGFDLWGLLLGLVAAVAAIVALRRRFRRSSGEEREQMKWFVYAAVATLVLLPARTVLVTNIPVLSALGFASIPILPIAVGIAIFKYRLYDIDVVINKTVVFGALAAFITAVYVAIVVGIGTAIGQGSKPNLGLSILATAVVAVAFQPVRERVQRFANRLVYGKRATPYEVLSELGHRMASTYAADDVLSRMARILAAGTGAAEATVWLRISGELTPAAGWPEAAGNGPSPDLRRSDLLVPVAHQGEDLGALSIRKPPGERLTPAEEKLSSDLASQAGLVLRNVRLIEELKASRVRLVQAQDEERRRIERNIHDGAQQQLVALQVKLGLARGMAAHPNKLDALLTDLQDETNQALQDLRDLARGFYPPLVADQGLTAALEAQARRAAIPVTVEAATMGRFPQEQEAAVYFCVLEALQNVAKYAGATYATVRLAESAGRLTFEVADDGVGFDPSLTSYGTGLQGMADRLAALGGELEVRSAPATGTTVAGRVTVRALAPVG